MFQKIAKHRSNDASYDVHRPPLFQSPEFLGKEPDHLEGGSGNKKTADMAAQFHADVTNQTLSFMFYSL